MNTLKLLLIPCLVAVSIAQRLEESTHDITEGQRRSGAYGLLRPGYGGNQGAYGGYPGGYNGHGSNLGGYGSNLGGYGSNLGGYGSNLGGYGGNLGGYGGNLGGYGGNLGGYGGNLGGYGGHPNAHQGLQGGPGGYQGYPSGYRYPCNNPGCNNNIGGYLGTGGYNNGAGGYPGFGGIIGSNQDLYEAGYGDSTAYPMFLAGYRPGFRRGYDNRPQSVKFRYSQPGYNQHRPGYPGSQNNFFSSYSDDNNDNLSLIGRKVGETEKSSAT